jgi:glycosyltransferase involved in cell wall biosynthesis
VATSEGTEEGVEFLGFVTGERKMELLRRAWAVLYPSPKEGWGLTNIEAAACGTPAIASDSPGLRESVASGRSGFLVVHEDPAAWAARLRELTERPELRERLGQGAIEHAGRFSWDRAADETEAWLEDGVRASGSQA